jgi:hypothetical protein
LQLFQSAVCMILHSFHQRTLQLLGILLVSGMFSSKIASRIAVRAFTSSRTRSLTAARLPGCVNSAQFRWKSTQGVAVIEEDLDAALDSLLGDAFKEAGDESHIRGSHPLPKNLLEEVSFCIRLESSLREKSHILLLCFLWKVDPVDYTDPKFLSTSNPRWVEAGLSQQVIDVLSGKGIVKFTPVQGEAFDPVLAGRDVIGRSRTGTGKTLAFGIPAITRLVTLATEKGIRDENGRMARGRPVSMIVMCPTRELARQVQEELASVCRPLGLFTEVFHGGVSYDPQARALRQGVDIVVGTPGRVIDHIQRGNLRLNQCEVAVLDEADEMLNMGFADDVETVLEGLGKDNGHKSQVLLFSATTPSWVKEIGKQYQEDVLAIDATSSKGGARVAETVRHMAIQVPNGKDAKLSVLEDIIAVEISRDMKGVGDDSDSDSDDDAPVNVIAAAALAKKKSGVNAMQQTLFGKTIVFTETKRAADELVGGGIFKTLTAQVSDKYIDLPCQCLNLNDLIFHFCLKGIAWGHRTKAA